MRRPYQIVMPISSEITSYLRNLAADKATTLTKNNNIVSPHAAPREAGAFLNAVLFSIVTRPQIIKP